MPEISIITPAYMQNDEQIAWLAEAIESVRAQSFTAWELIIVDDASPEALDGPTQGPIRLIHHDRRRGAGAARNTAIAAATSPFLLCLDADDRLKPDALQTLYAARCGYGVVYGDLEYIGAQTGHHRLPDWSLDLLLRGTSPLAVTALFPREAWRAVGGFDESLPGLEDVDFWIKLAERHYCGRRIDDTIFEYRRHASSRQAGLEADSRAKMRAVVEIIQHRYRKVARNMPSCAKCPGSGGVGTGVQAMLPSEVGDETVRLRYVGPMRGSFMAHGFGSGAKYFVNGRGDTITVDVRDVPNLMKRSTGGRPDFELLADAPAAVPPPDLPTTPQVIENPPSNLPALTSMNAKEAIAQIETTEDVVDLAVWLAEERASEKPRKTVIEALEAQIASLQAAG